VSAEYYRIGVIVRPHGVHGAVKVEPLTDSSRRFRGLSEAFLEMHGEMRPVHLSVASVAPDAVILTVEGCDTPEAANALRGTYLCVDRAHRVKLPKDTYFVTDLIGCDTFDTDGNAFGKLTNVYETGANDVYEIANGKLMVPALKRVLNEVDTDGGRIVFDAAVLKEVGLFED
jgi:16S rRNA processing protein RimM